MILPRVRHKCPKSHNVWFAFSYRVSSCIDSLTVAHTGIDNSHLFRCCSLTTLQTWTSPSVLSWAFVRWHDLSIHQHSTGHSCGLRIGQPWTFRTFTNYLFRALPGPANKFGHFSHSKQNELFDSKYMFLHYRKLLNTVTGCSTFSSDKNIKTTKTKCKVLIAPTWYTQL